MQLIPDGSDAERLALIDDFMNEDNGYILDCIFDLRMFGLALMSKQLIARTERAEAVASEATENTAAALSQVDLAGSEVKEATAAAEVAAEVALQSARSEAAEVSIKAQRIVEEQLQASRHAEALIRDEANAAISQRDA